MKYGPWQVAFLLCILLVLFLSLPVPAQAESAVLESYLRARDDLRYQADSLQRAYSELSRAIESRRSKVTTRTYGQDDKKKAREEIVQAIYELQRRLQWLDSDAAQEKKEIYEKNAETVELEASLHEVDLRLVQTLKSLDEVNRLLKNAK
jgi:hypothetical protein